MARAYREVRKDYINARTDTILRGSSLRRRDAREAACREFDEFVQDQRRIAVAEAATTNGLSS